MLKERFKYQIIILLLFLTMVELESQNKTQNGTQVISLDNAHNYVLLKQDTKKFAIYADSVVQITFEKSSVKFPAFTENDSSAIIVKTKTNLYVVAWNKEQVITIGTHNMKSLVNKNDFDGFKSGESVIIQFLIKNSQNEIDIDELGIPIDKSIFYSTIIEIH